MDFLVWSLTLLTLLLRPVVIAAASCGVSRFNATRHIDDKGEGSIICPNGGPVVGMSYLSSSERNGTEVSLVCESADCWPQHWSNKPDQWIPLSLSSGLTFYCPSNAFLVGVKVYQDMDISGIICREQLGHSINTSNCWNVFGISTYLDASYFESADRDAVVTSIASISLLSSYNIWFLQYCQIERTETISCKVPLIPNGHASSTQFLELDSGTLVHVNDSINVTCAGGHYISGSSSTVKCQNDGNWTTIPKCTRCPSIPDCVIETCTSRESVTCLRCSTWKPFRLSPSKKSCDLAPLVRIHPVVWSNNQPTITCSASGRPIPSVQWEKNDQVLTSARTVNVTAPSTTISVSVASGSYYTCRATNDMGTDLDVFYVSNEPPQNQAPWITYDGSCELPEVCEIQPNASLELQCRAHGNPPPSIYWFKQLQDPLPTPVVFSDGVTILDDESLFIQKLQEDDDHFYYCRAYNDLGYAQIAYYVIAPDLIKYETINNFVTGERENVTNPSYHEEFYFTKLTTSRQVY